MKRLVVDASAAIACCLGEADGEALADAILTALAGGTAVVPGIWASEVANVLVMKERTAQLLPAETTMLLTYLSHLPILVDFTDLQRTFSSVTEVARERRLSVYDAHYLELAERLDVPLASLDQQLLRAARDASIAIVDPKSP